MKDSTKYLIAVCVFSFAIMFSVAIYVYQKGIKTYDEGVLITTYNTWTGEKTVVYKTR